MHQLRAMLIGNPMLYDMTMLALVSNVKILINWQCPFYSDSILNTVKIQLVATGHSTKINHDQACTSV
jgi:hypothetical protein